jgi:hypothetical protein
MDKAGEESGVIERVINSPIMDAEMLALLDRKEHLCRRLPTCPGCGENFQIQLMAYFRAPASWRCRRCRRGFDHEPPAAKTPPVSEARRARAEDDGVLYCETDEGAADGQSASVETAPREEATEGAVPTPRERGRDDRWLETRERLAAAGEREVLLVARLGRRTDLLRRILALVRMGGDLRTQIEEELSRPWPP